MKDRSLLYGMRLHQSKDFTAFARREGKRQRGKFFLLRYRCNKGKWPRLAMAVSRKVSLRAVRRNRIKRQIRESFRHQRVRLPEIDVLVIAHRNADEQSNQALRRDLDRLWAQLATKTEKTKM